jgi:hypothetical protein
MTREGAGRYDNLHGDEDEIAASRPMRVSSCDECGSTDGCMCSVRRKRICCMCGADPCESPGACRAQARAENEERDEPRPETED